MKVITYEAVVENGQVKLPLDVHLPEQTKVYVVVPEARSAISIASPRLVRPEQAVYFEKKVVEEDIDAEIR